MNLFARIAASLAAPFVEHLARYIDAAMVSDYDVADDELADYHAAWTKAVDSEVETRHADEWLHFVWWETAPTVEPRRS